MTINFQAQVVALREVTSEHANNIGADICEATYVNSYNLLEWLAYLRTSESTQVCDSLVDGVQGAVIEVAACLSLGLVRPALFSLRAQIDMLLTWLYFRDHPVEWALIQDTGKGFRLKSFIVSYFDEYYPYYKTRFALLGQTRFRVERDPYHLLSVHIHSQTGPTVPSIGALNSVVREEALCNSCVDLQSEVSEYLTDVLLASFADKWASLPKSARDTLNTRLNEEQKAAFFK